MTPLNLTINGSPVSRAAEPRLLLVEFLREELRLTGTHVGCDTSQCGCCTVLVDGAAVKSCTMLAVQADGRSVTTIEGLAPKAESAAASAPTPAQAHAAPGGAEARALHPIQQAFIECHGLQCGYCTPGMIMTTAHFLAEVPQPTDDEIVHALEGNICRCTGYVNIVASVRRAAELLAEQGRGATGAAPAGAARAASPEALGSKVAP